METTDSAVRNVDTNQNEQQAVFSRGLGLEVVRHTLEQPRDLGLGPTSNLAESLRLKDETPRRHSLKQRKNTKDKTVLDLVFLSSTWPDGQQTPRSYIPREVVGESIRDPLILLHAIGQHPPQERIVPGWTRIYAPTSLYRWVPMCSGMWFWGSQVGMLWSELHRSIDQSSALIGAEHCQVASERASDGRDVKLPASVQKKPKLFPW